MFDALLKSKFYSKCKSDIKLTKTRIEMIMRKRKVMQKFLRSDVADLLKNGLGSNAYGRVEGLYVEQNLSSCYEFVEQSCFHILTHLSAMDKHRECPQECKEPIASLMFAAARFADLPELRELRRLFSERYGNYVEPFVNKEFVKKLKAHPPSKEIKLQIMQEIALESGIKWDSKALEQKLYNPPLPVQDWSRNVNKDVNATESPENTHFYGRTTQIQEAEVKDFNNQAEIAKKKEDRGLGNKKRDPYWSSNTSSSSESTTSPEYSTDPDDGSSEDVVEERKFFGFRSMAPPYVKTDHATKNGTSSDTSSSSSREEKYVIGSKHKDDNQANSTKPVPRSVRRRPFKPVPISHDENEVPKPTPKFQNGEICDHDHRDDEEKKMDKLLLHFSKKPSALPPDSTARNNGCRDGRAPTRAGSLPAESCATQDVTKGYARAVSYQPDSNLSSPLGHVHPKLPDYDDFVARLAALRASS